MTLTTLPTLAHDPQSPLAEGGRAAIPVAPAGRGWWSAAVVTLLLAAVPALWPGDGLWLWDEPMEFALALDANHQRRLAQGGLSGSFPVPYGALGIQLYQFWLLFTHDPRKLMVLHALGCSVPTALALLWMSRTLRLNPWFAAAVLPMPYVWLEFRRMWQPSFCIPLGALAMAAYAAFLRARSGRCLLLAIGCAIAPLFIHLQSFPLSAAILGHILLRHRPDLRRHWLGVSVVLAVFLALQGAWLVATVMTIARNCIGYVQVGHNSHTTLPESCLAPFLGGRLFSGWDWGKNDGRGRWFDTLRVLASGPILLVWVGLGLVARRLVTGGAGVPPGSPRADCRGAAPAADSVAGAGGMAGDDPGAKPVLSYWNPFAPTRDLVSPDTAPIPRSMLTVCAAGLAIQLAMSATARLSVAYYYYFGTFGMYVFLAWIGLGRLPHRWLRAGFIAVTGLAAAGLTGRQIWETHQEGWNRHRAYFSPTLDEQIALVRSLDRHADQTAFTDIEVYKARPFVLWDLRQLLGASTPGDRTYSGRLCIRYRPDASGRPTDRLELVETDRTPPDAVLLALTPQAQTEVDDWEAMRNCLAKGDVDAHPPRRFRSVPLDTFFPNSHFYLTGTAQALKVDAGGAVAVLTDNPRSFAAGMCLVRNATSARLAGAAALSLLPGPHGPAIVAPEDVQVQAADGGWVCRTARGSTLLQVRFDPSGQCRAVQLGSE